MAASARDPVRFVWARSFANRAARHADPPTDPRLHSYDAVRPIVQVNPCSTHGDTGRSGTPHCVYRTLVLYDISIVTKYGRGFDRNRIPRKEEVAVHPSAPGANHRPREPILGTVYLRMGRTSRSAVRSPGRTTSAGGESFRNGIRGHPNKEEDGVQQSLWSCMYPFSKMNGTLAPEHS